MNLRVGDKVKILSGQYKGKRGTVAKLYQVIDNVQGDDSHDVTWHPTDGFRAAFDVLVSVVGFRKVWFTPEQITKIDHSDKP